VARGDRQARREVGPRGQGEVEQDLVVPGRDDDRGEVGDDRQAHEHEGHPEDERPVEVAGSSVDREGGREGAEQQVDPQPRRDAALLPVRAPGRGPRTPGASPERPGTPNVLVDPARERPHRSPPGRRRVPDPPMFEDARRVVVSVARGGEALEERPKGVARAARSARDGAVDDASCRGHGRSPARRRPSGGGRPSSRAARAITSLTVTVARAEAVQRSSRNRTFGSGAATPTDFLFHPFENGHPLRRLGREPERASVGRAGRSPRSS
jgi:hypothetical protein